MSDSSHHAYAPCITYNPDAREFALIQVDAQRKKSVGPLCTNQLMVGTLLAVGLDPATGEVDMVLRQTGECQETYKMERGDTLWLSSIDGSSDIGCALLQRNGAHERSLAQLQAAFASPAWQDGLETRL